MMAVILTNTGADSVYSGMFERQLLFGRVDRLYAYYRTPSAALRGCALKGGCMQTKQRLFYPLIV